MSAVRVRATSTQRGVDFDIALDAGEVVAVLGPNGVGKSTLLMMIAGLLRPDRGLVEIGGEPVTDTERDVFVAPHARGVAMLGQQPLLFPHLSVAANVGYGPRCARRSRSAARAAARSWLDAVGLADLAGRKPAQLSGGQAQRVALARALAAEPRLLLLDEPLSALDVTAAPPMRRLLRAMLSEQRRTALIVTHDLLDALAVADSVAVIEGGRVVERGPVRRVLAAPRSDFAARIAGINLVSGRMSRPREIRTSWGATIAGVGELPVGAEAVALCRPAAVAVYPHPPEGSPRNVIPVTIAGLDAHGPTVRIRGADQPDGSTGLAADITAAAAADLDLEPGRRVYFAVKASEVEIHPALPA